MAERRMPRIATAAVLAALGLAGLLVMVPGHGTAGWRTASDDARHQGLRQEQESSPPPPSNEPPTAKDATRRVEENGPDLSIDLARLASDKETSDEELDYRLSPSSRLGTVKLSGSVVTYDVDPDVYGKDAFGYGVVDGGSPDGCDGPPGCAESREAKGTITIIIERARRPTPEPHPSPFPSPNPSRHRRSPNPIGPSNHAPSARAYAETVTGKRPVAIDLAELVRDAETADAHLTYELASPRPAKGDVSLARSVARYAAHVGEQGTDSFGYRVTDRGAPDGCRTESRRCKPPRSAHGLVTIRISGPSPSPTGPDLVFEEPPTLELVPGVAGDAVTDRPIVVLAAASESLRLRAVVANVGGADAPATSIVIASEGWSAPRAPVPSIRAGDATPIEFVTPAPDGISEDTEFTISIESVEGERDPDNNAASAVLVKGEGGNSPTTAIVALAVLALVAAVGLALFLRFKKVPRVSLRTRSSRQRRQQARVETEGLADLADRYLGGDPASPLWLAGPNADLFREALEDDDLATSNLATVYWRTLLETRAYSKAMKAAGASRAAIKRPDVLVVAHAEGTRCDLVVLDPSFSLSEPSGTPIELSTEELSSACDQVLPRLRMPASALGMADLARAMKEVHSFEKFGLVVAPKPEIVPLHSPSPAWPVAHEDEEPTSTAGMAAIDGKGRKGVTVAYHAVLGRERVWVDGIAGEVVSSDPISDSSFVEVDHPIPASVRGGKGPLSGMSPRQMEVVEFDGIRSGKATTRVVGWDPTILTMESYIQNKIVTDPVTMPGDSGAALIDGDGHVLGFAFYTTGLNAQPAHSGWIWADSVYRFHDLRRVEEG